MPCIKRTREGSSVQTDRIRNRSLKVKLSQLSAVPSVSIIAVFEDICKAKIWDEKK
jgi:hypothetical protein